MGALRTRHAVGADGTGSRRDAAGAGLHPLLQLQQLAGNDAVAALVQRKANTFHSSKVAVAPMAAIYEGKCDASTTGASVSRDVSHELLDKRVTIAFRCGPQAFEFSATVPYFGKRFPWSLELPDGGDAWVTEEVSKGLDDIDGNIDEAGSTFWSGYHTILGRLGEDLKAYCSDE